MAGHDVHGSADDEYLVTPEGSTYEHTDARTGIIVKFLAWLIVSAVLIHIGLAGMYWLLIRNGNAAAAVEVPYPLAAERGDRLPPVPRLQQQPANEIYEFRRGEDAHLHSYGWQNKEAGIVHIPIEDAMRLTVERGLLGSRPAGAPEVAPNLMPADSSAGRTLEVRRQ